MKAPSPDHSPAVSRQELEQRARNDRMPKAMPPKPTWPFPVRTHDAAEAASDEVQKVSPSSVRKSQLKDIPYSAKFVNGWGRG